MIFLMIFFDVFFGGVGDVFERGFLHSFKLKNTLKRAVMVREEGGGGQGERGRARELRSRG